MTSDSHLSSRAAGAVDAVRRALKGEARHLKMAAAARGQTMPLSAAIEEVARGRGFRDWNALSAHVARGGDVMLTGNPRHPWEDLEKPLPMLPTRLIEPNQEHSRASTTEVMRWARQLEVIATKVPDESRPELVELLGERTPYVLECDSNRWPDRRFHLCDRGYTAFKGFALTREQLLALGLPAWNTAHGSHDGVLSFTVIGDDRRYSRDTTMLRHMARLLASLAREVDSGLGQALGVPRA